MAFDSDLHPVGTARVGRHVVSPRHAPCSIAYVQLVLLGVVLLLSVILAGAAAAGVLLSVVYGIRHSARVQQARALVAIPRLGTPNVRDVAT